MLDTVQNEFEAELVKSKGSWNLCQTEFIKNGSKESILADKYGQIFDEIAEKIDRDYPKFNHVEKQVILSTSQTNLDLNTPEEALGFFYVISEHHDYDRNEMYLNVPEKMTCFVIVDNHLDLISDEFDFEAALMTMPHEMLHTIEWLEATHGRTPLEVFDQENGLEALEDTLSAINHAAVNEKDCDDSEDFVEKKSGEYIDALGGRTSLMFEEYNSQLKKNNRPKL